MIRKIFFYCAIAILAGCTVAKKKVTQSQLSIVCEAKSAVPGNYIDSVLSEKCKIMLHLKDKFTLKKEVPLKANLLQLEFKNETDLIIAKTRFNIDDSAAITILRDKQFLIDNLFKVQPSPYPDQVSNAINCPDSLRPVTYMLSANGNWIFAYRLFANNRNVYGECSGDANVYISAYIFSYSKQDQILNEIKYFTPIAKPSVNIDEMVKGICIVAQ